MYYDYGEIETDLVHLTVPSAEAYGRPGQSGSPLIYSDPFESYSIGVLVFSSHYRHTRISNSIYFQFKNILDQDVEVGVAENQELHFKAYPNPTSGNLTIEMDELDGSLRVNVSNAIGQQVFNEEYVNKGLIGIGIPGDRGLYFIELKTDTQRRVFKVVKD